MGKYRDGYVGKNFYYSGSEQSFKNGRVSQREETITTLTKFAQEQTTPEDEALIMEAIDKVKESK